MQQDMEESYGSLSPILGRPRERSGPSAQGSSTRVHNTSTTPRRRIWKKWVKLDLKEGGVLRVYFILFFARGRLACPGFATS
jgi:hypothetical protein